MSIISSLSLIGSNSNVEPYQETKTNTGVYAPPCICGETLILSQASNCYTDNSHSVCCDCCGLEQNDQANVYHCNDGQMIKHQHGYDLCLQCAHHIRNGVNCHVGDVLELGCSSSDDEKIQKQQVHDESTPASCNKDVLNCVCLAELISTMNMYQQCKLAVDTTSSLDINVANTLDNYMHLISEHSTNEQFECIVDQLSPCDMKRCTIFKRNHRDRDNVNEENAIACNQQILDKIHCYFSHCYDIGNRLSINDRKAVYDDEKHMQSNDGDAPFDRGFTNTQMTKINNILRTKYVHNDLEMSKRVYGLEKYNQLSMQTENTNGDKVYSYGFEFAYEKSEYTQGRGVILVANKYTSLKEELLQNPIATINIAQYTNEFQKAEIHLRSQFVKRAFHSFIDKDSIQWTFTIEYLMALMFYCNYITLQYEFSKTYRENNGIDHDNFYHMAKYLKAAVKQFGTEIHKGCVGKFYHGISDKFIFPEYIGSHDNGGSHLNPRGVSIKGPLSTSSVFEVAVNFANFNQGLIVEFTANDGVMTDKSAKYFAVSWLSDFGNESEFLFVQNGYYEKLRILNVLEPESGVEFEQILTAMRVIHDVMSVDGYKYDRTVAPITKQLIIGLIHHQLSYSLSSYKALPMLHHYAKQIINTYCNSKVDVILNHSLMKNSKYSFLRNLFFRLDCEWIKMNEITLLFPNTKYIHVQQVDINCAVIRDHILNFLNENKGITSIDWITIQPKMNNEVPISSIATKFKQPLDKIGFDISVYCGPTLSIEKKTK
eukprot:452808_1